MRWKIEFGQFITFILIFLIIQIAIFINFTPRLTISYQENRYSKTELQAIKAIEGLEWGGISDPLPCWLELKVLSISKDHSRETIKDNAPLPVQRSRQIPAIELVGDRGEEYEGPLVQKPPESYVVIMLVTQPSWSRLLSSDYALTGSKICFCVNSK